MELLRSQLNAITDDDDALIESWAVTARMMVEADSRLSLVRKTVKHRLPEFPGNGYIELPRGPVVSVESIQYFDADDNEQTLDESKYRVDLERFPAVIWDIAGNTWPWTSERHDAVTVSYTTGHDPEDNPAPEVAKGAIMLLVAHWYKNREAVGTVGTEIALGYERLINLLLEETYP